MYPINPLSSIHLGRAVPTPVLTSQEPALQPSKQSLVTIPVVTPSLENLVLAEPTLKLKLSAIESKTQGNPAKAHPLFPQVLLDLEAYTDPSEVFPFIDSLTVAPIRYLRLSPAVLNLINIAFIHQCQAQGLKLFLDLDLSLTDLQSLPSLSYTDAALVSYHGHGASALGAEAAIESHHRYLPAASMVFKSSHFRSLERTINFVKDILSCYQTLLPSTPSLSLSQVLPPLPCLLCQPEELSLLRQHFGPTLPLIVNAESSWVAGTLEITKLPALHMASFILLGRSILGAENPQLELEHIFSYLRSFS